MNNFKWRHFNLPPSIIPDENIYEILVYVDHRGIYHFFGYSILWCLGYEHPHVSMQTLVPPPERIDPSSFIHGIFLTEWTVRRLCAEKTRQDPSYKSFEDWFKSYLSTCKGNNPTDICPRFSNP